MTVAASRRSGSSVDHPASSSQCRPANPYAEFENRPLKEVRGSDLICPNKQGGCSNEHPAQDNGRMFWFIWKRLSGSYFVLSSWSRR
jgi:hypothetical protein